MEDDSLGELRADHVLRPELEATETQIAPLRDIPNGPIAPLLFG